MRTLVLFSAILLTCLSIASAASVWEAVATELLEREKTGFGGLCGVVVDHKSGDVFLNLSDAGMFRSSDQGKTWTRTAAMKGRTESPGCLMFDPTGKTKTILSALVYGAAIAVSDDNAATFRHMEKRSEHADWCAVDWTDPERRFVLALKHEAVGLLIASNDAGKTFRDAGSDVFSGWVFDGKTAVVAMEKTDSHPKPTLQRTTDGGKTFKSCGNFTPVGVHSSRALPKWLDRRLFWLTDKGLISSQDKGVSWESISIIKDSVYGPVAGNDKGHRKTQRSMFFR